MKTLKLTLIIAVATMFSGYAIAQVDLCGPLQTKVNQSMQDRVSRSAPTQSPSAYVDTNSDVRGILKQDVTSGFSKLMSLDFGSLATAIIDRGLTGSSQKASSAFNDNVGKIVQSYQSASTVQQQQNQTPATTNAPNLSYLQDQPLHQTNSIKPNPYAY